MSTPPPAEQLFKIAELKKPYGIKGWLWVFSETEDREAIFTMQPWWMKTATGFKPLHVTNWRTQGSGLVAQFAEVPDRTLAETMHGVSIWSLKDNLPKPEADEYYWSDLIGLQVHNEQDEYLGDIKEMFDSGAHSVMVVQATAQSLDGQERLIPWHKQTVLHVDLPAKQVRVAWQSDY